MFGKDKAEEGGHAARGAVKAALDAKGAAPAKANAAPSLISADMKVVGNLHSAGDIQIDGTVEGDIQSRTVTVGEGAEIKGSIKAEQVRVGGRVSGKIEATQVRIAKTANVQGDITYKTLAIEEEAVIEGTWRRMESAKPTTVAAGSEAAKPAPEAKAAEAKVALLKPS